MHSLSSAARSQRNFWRLLRLIGGIGVTCAVLAYAFTHIIGTLPAHATGGLTFSQFATHPYASQAGYDNTSRNYYTNQQLCPPPQTFCPTGQYLIDMNVTADGKLIAGYGDYGSNVDSFGVAAGRVGVVPLDLATGTWGSIFYAGTEEMEIIRKINGHLYIPTTDPSDRAATGNYSGNISGYLTNDTGTWRFVSNGRNDIHTFDVATRTGTDLWTVGRGSGQSGQAPAAAAAWQSLDGGATWTLGYQGNGTSSMERFYWAAALGSKLYLQDSEPLNTAPAAFDGTSWSAAPELTCNSVIRAKNIEVFQDSIVCPSRIVGGGAIDVFDGTATTQSTFDPAGGEVRDFYATDTHLYVLSARGVYRTASLSNPSWERLSWPNPSTAITRSFSIAVHDDEVYLGGMGGIIYKSDQTLADMQPVVLDPAGDHCFAFTAATGTITAFYPALPGCDETDLVIPAEIENTAVTSIGATAFLSKGFTSVVLPSTVTNIGSGAFQGNSITDLVIPDSVTSIGSFAFVNNLIIDLAIPDSVTSIGSGAFSGNRLTTVVIGNGVTNIGTQAFFGNGSSNQITNLTLGASVANIGHGAFSGNRLATLTIPDSVTSIDSLAFANNAITQLTIGKGVTTVNSSAFSGTDNTLETLSVTMTTIPPSLFSGRKIRHLTLGDTVTSIGASAFAGNQIADLTVPSSVTSIGNQAFASNPLADVHLKGIAVLGDDVFLSAAFNVSNVVACAPTATVLEDYIPCYHQETERAQAQACLLLIRADHPEHYPSQLATETAFSNYFGIPPPVIGGYLINPTTVTTSFRDASGTTVAPSTTRTGPQLTDYRLSSLFARGFDPETDTLDDFYYSSGQSVTLTPPAIDGYILPAAYTGVLSPSASIAFVYNRVATSTPPATTPPTPSPRPPAVAQRPTPSDSTDGTATPATPQNEAESDDTSRDTTPGNSSHRQDTYRAESSNEPATADTRRVSMLWFIIAGVVLVLGSFWFIIAYKRRKKDDD